MRVWIRFFGAIEDFNRDHRTRHIDEHTNSEQVKSAVVTINREEPKSPDNRFSQPSLDLSSGHSGSGPV